MPYQDIWIEGELDVEGERECASRYAVVAEVLAEFDRPFTLLDLGAADGYFGIRASQDFDCVSVLVDPNPALPPLCARNPSGKTIVLSRQVTIEDIERMASCEHFDVVLALNILHHFPDPDRVVSAVMSLGDRTIVETPPLDDVGACGQPVIPRLYEELSSRGGRLLTHSPSHVSDSMRPMWVFDTPKTSIDRSYIDQPENLALGPVRIESTATTKRLTLGRKGEERDWIPGINLRTYQHLEGAHPPLDAIEGMIRNVRLPEPRHGDVRPWNFILDGERVHLIDGRDEHAIFDDREGLEFTIEALRAGVVPAPWNDSD